MTLEEISATGIGDPAFRDLDIKWLETLAAPFLIVVGLALFVWATGAAGGIGAIYVGLTFFQMSLAQLAVFLYILTRTVPEAYSLNRSRFNVAGFLSHFTNIMDLVET